MHRERSLKDATAISSELVSILGMAEMPTDLMSAVQRAFWMLARTGLRPVLPFRWGWPGVEWAGPAPEDRPGGEVNGRVPGVGAGAAAGGETEGSIASTERRGNNVILWTDQLEKTQAQKTVCA